MNLDNLTIKIRMWSREKGINKAEPSKQQMLKLMEEVGELAQGLAKDNRDQVIDSIGDVYVVLTILAQQLDLDIEDCVKLAYEEIADRKGKMINGVFVKDGF
jgi:NTP pyrophosphatase (non-canonical NTP hydrolase)